MYLSPSVGGLWAVVVVFAALTLWYLGTDQSLCIDKECVTGPWCSSHCALSARVSCAFFRVPVRLDRGDYQNEVLSRLRQLTERNLKGQRHVVESVIKDIALKLAHPDKPLVLHFAGDNGVGKTTLAQLVSLVLAFNCRDAVCMVGDTTLVLSGVSYDGYSASAFRRDVVQKVVRHAAAFPRNGVVIINDLGALHPDLVRVLLPLLGRASVFPEAPQTPINSLTVIITTDFGRQGRTQGKSLVEMRRIVEDDFKSLYSHLSTSMIKTYPFLPVSLATAKEIVRLAISDYRCRHKDRIREIHLGEDVAAWFVDLVRDDLPMENGRSVVNAVTAAVGPGVLHHLLDTPAEPVSLRVDLDDNGSVTVLLVH
ncbi:hypothetical protein DQ04_02741020 [Trypanosoma grayi]|uniref:hypothetical protein n=1 Tax=Trypanosoma grayi TaxID=71804 RepID=UPI0004F48219|nr:hypothetical protein DQ04_02741020 [Trypanosoma grayi]KEG11317.1 hypothetical protein DQ04_02741020 [Trypanosoma grayi]